ncbi:hypothetical protein GE09DRAFT_135439 [Coniochaeta sp. 2T2.1]|nr:hypothetical protein GE09DRAFT_135439 [Coniochaeta sp. 2T2.1]
MDQHLSDVRGRSPSGAGDNGQLHKRVNGHSPSPARFPNTAQDNNTISANSLGLGIEFGSQQYQSDLSFDPSQSFSSNQQSQLYPPQPNQSDPSGAFDPNQDFTQQLKNDDNSYGHQTQGSYSQQLLSNDFSDDFTIFPPASGEQYNAPLFATDSQQLGGADENMMATLGQNPNQPGSARQSPNLFQTPSFSPPVQGHSRHASLQPEMAFLPRQLDWAAPQFQGHRRNPSDISDVSSVAPSPNLSIADAFDQGHSPLHLPQDASLHDLHDLQGISNFSISDQGTHSPNHHHGRSPSHSPAISPRLLPQQMPDMQQQHQQQQNYLLQMHNNASYGPPASYSMQQPEAFPLLPQGGDMQVPNIQVDYAPTHGVDQPNKSSLDADSLTPPDRGRPKQRQRAVTDPFNSGAVHLGHNRTNSASGSLSPNTAGGRAEASRSLSPLVRSGSGSASLSPSPMNRRRQSTSAVPNNVIALRLAGEEGYISSEMGPPGAKGRVQKHPATFQCDKCPKRFTRAYNLRSHLRTHTNERPFKCTVCSKSFARQHDRKRHESLHSGEKKFVCKGELQGGVQWGCGRRFARADALGRHFRSEAGRICIKPLLDEERQQKQNEQFAAQQQGMMMQPPQGMLMAPNMDPNSFPAFPQALIQQFPFLATSWTDATDMGGGNGMEDENSGLSNFEGSDYDDEGEGGYVSGPGTGFGPGSVNENYGAAGYASDFGGR